MKTVTIHTEKNQNLFEDLNTNIGGTVTFDLDEHILEVENDFAEGIITAVSFSDNISYVQFDMIFSEDLCLNISNEESQPLYLAYCSKGSLSHSFDLSTDSKKINAFQTAIVNTKQNQNNILFFQKDIRTKCTLIIIGNEITEVNHGYSLNSQVRKTFIEGNTASNFFYLSSYNLKIDRKIDQLSVITETGIAKNIMKEGILRIILAMEIQQYSDDQKALSHDTNCLTLKELEEIRELSQAIEANPEEAFSIKSLCKQAGLSPNKLQEGFKLIHNRTVNDHITHMRVLKAEILIRTSDLNISEIVYCIGFTSRSYFSKIFKQKFNCSPKDYKYNLNPLAITA